MKSGIDVNARSNLRIFTNADEVTVKEHTPVIDEPISTDADVDAVVAGERRLDLCAVPDMSKQCFQCTEPLLGILVWYGIQASQPLLRCCQRCLKIRVC